MKKLTLLLMALAILTSCKKDKGYNYNLVYAVYYNPTTTDTVSVLVRGEAKLWSSQGANYISIEDDGILFQTTAPIKIIEQIQLP